MYSFKLLVLFSFIFLFGFLTANNAFAQNCPRHKTTMILDPDITKPKVFRGSAARLTEWTTGHTQTVGTILGLGGGEIGTKFQVSFEYSTTPQGGICVLLDKVKARFYARPRMYIASDYKKGSCEYEEIVKHEKRHVKALQDFHEVQTDRLRVQLGRIAKRIPMFGPVTEAEIPATKQMLMDYVMGEYFAYANKEMMALQRIQQKIDHPNEYRGVASRCDNW